MKPAARAVARTALCVCEVGCVAAGAPPFLFRRIHNGFYGRPFHLITCLRIGISNFPISPPKPLRILLLPTIIMPMA